MAGCDNGDEFVVADDGLIEAVELRRGLDEAEVGGAVAEPVDHGGGVRHFESDRIPGVIA